MQIEAKTTGIPAAVLDVFDNLIWEDVTAEALENFTVTGVENGCQSLTLCGIYPMTSTQLHVFNIYSEEDSVYMKFQRAQIPEQQK